MARDGSNQKVANSLVAMSSAAVLAVYAAGYVRTRPAADRIAQQAIARAISRQAPPIDTPADTSAATVVPTGVEEAKPAAPASTAAPNSVPKHAAAVSVKAAAPASAANAANETASAAATPAPAEISSAASPAPAPAISAAPVAEPTAAVVVPIAPPPPPASKVWKDGKYVAWGGSPHGDIQATVVIEGGKILSAEISSCQTKYPCDMIEKLPPQAVKRQSPNVDRISGATESSDAFYSAVYFALGQAH
jgi:uncharacterized protein with FMN-binding domain